MNNPKTEEIVAAMRNCASKDHDACAACNRTWDVYSNCVDSLLTTAADLIEQLQQELIDERYRHDRLQDFCVAQGEELSALKGDLESLATANGCSVCAHHGDPKDEYCNVCDYDHTEFKWRGVNASEPPKED